jgi:hypothetical protein
MHEREHRRPPESPVPATPTSETGAGMTPMRMLALQRAAGNHAVAGLVAGKVEGALTEEEAPAGAGRSPKLRLRLVGVAQRKDSDGAAAAGRLGFKNESGPTTSDCGGYTWTVQWELDKASPKGGWIVQGVTASLDVKDAAGKAVDIKKLTGGKIDPADWTPYWEAWKVNAGQKVTTYAEKGDLKDDTYWMSGLYDTTKGTIKIEGKAEFYEDLTLPDDFKRTDKAPAWILPMTRKKPTLAGGTGSIEHNLTATWDCTAGSKSKATTVTTSKPTK